MWCNVVSGGLEEKKGKKEIVVWPTLKGSIKAKLSFRGSGYENSGPSGYQGPFSGGLIPRGMVEYF